MNILKKAKFFLVALSVFLYIIPNSWAKDYQNGSILVETPWSRATPQGAKVAGGYMHIYNKGHEEDALVSVSSPLTPKIEIHEMKVENNVMKMRKLDAPLKIAANSDIEFKPGSYHIMFMDLKSPLKQGDIIPAKLHFSKSPDIDIEFVVEKLGATKPTK